MKLKSAVLSAAAVSATLFGGVAMAAGNASLSLGGGSYRTGSSFAVPIYVNSGSDPVNVVQADFSYNPSVMRFQGASCGGAFGITAGLAANSVTCGVSGGATVTGSQLVGTINFKALTAGNSTANIASTSHVYRSTDNADIWNGVATATAFAFSRPVSTAPATPAAPAASAAATATPAATAKPKTTKKSVDHKNVATASPIKNSSTGNWILLGVLLVILAAVLAAAAWAARYPNQYRTYKKSTRRLYRQGLQLIPFTNK